MAMPNKGALTVTGYGVESAYGTAVAPSFWPGLVQDFSDNSEMHVEEVRGAGTYEPAQMVNLEFNGKGSLDTILQDGRLLVFAFNSGATTGSPWTHNMAIAGTGAFRSTTWEVAHRGGAATPVTWYPGVKFSKITLTQDARDMLHLKADFVAKTGSLVFSGAPTSITASTSAPYIYSQGALTVDGVAVTELKNAEITLNVALDPESGFYIGSSIQPVLTDLPETAVSTEGTFTIGHVGGQMTQRLFGWSGAGVPQQIGSNFNLQLKYTRSATDSITLTLSGCRMTSAPPAGANEGALDQKVSFKATNRSCAIADGLSGTNFYF